VREYSKDRYQCLGKVSVGGAPTSLKGVSAPPPSTETCGQTFRPCHFCGGDCGGYCQGGCGRQTCNRHTTRHAGKSLCPVCLESHIRRDEARELALSEPSPQELAESLENYSLLLERRELLRAWQSLLARHSLPASHEIVELVFQRSLRPATPSWRVTNRHEPLWLAQDAIQYPSGAYPPEDAALNAEGALCVLAGAPELPRRGSQGSISICLPKGDNPDFIRTRASSGEAVWVVTNGRALKQRKDASEIFPSAVSRAIRGSLSLQLESSESA
jgi:hypothetical protein